MDSKEVDMAGITRSTTSMMLQLRLGGTGNGGTGLSATSSLESLANAANAPDDPIDVDGEVCRFPIKTEEIDQKIEGYQRQIAREERLIEGFAKMVSFFDALASSTGASSQPVSPSPKLRKKTNMGPQPSFQSIEQISTPVLLKSTSNMVSRSHTDLKQAAMAGGKTDASTNSTSSLQSSDAKDQLKRANARLSAYQELLRRIRVHKDQLIRQPEGSTGSVQQSDKIDKLNERIFQKTIHKDVYDEYSFVEPLSKANAQTKTFRVKQKTSGALMAMKQIKVSMESLNGIMNELEIVRGVISPYCIRYYGFYFSGMEQKLSIVTELCDGSIGDYLADDSKTLSEPQIACTVSQVLQGLAYLHSRDIVHMNLKASNVLLTKRGRVKLADYGLSLQAERCFALGKAFAEQISLGRKGDNIVTPFWLAPEVLQCKTFFPGGKSDIWSLGMTIIEMAESNPPLLMECLPNRAIEKIIKDPSPTFRHPKMWTADASDFLASCVRKDYEKRPSTSELSNHPFVQNAPNPDVLAPILEFLQKRPTRRNNELSISRATSDLSSSRSFHSFV